MGSSWFHTYQALPDPALRLVCFPHAGGSPTAYRTWQRRLPEDVGLLSVCYPGRQARLTEPLITDMATMVAGITDALGEYLDTPIALFGHSMGSAIAYETALRLERRHGVRVTRLFVSGRAAPHTVEVTELHTADDLTIATKISRLGSETAHLLTNRALMDLLLPPLRADLRLIETYNPAVPERVSCPLVVYSGDRDPGCAGGRMAAWSQLTAARAEYYPFPGGHFYLEDQEPDLLHHICGHLVTDLRLLRVA